jgi:serine phosphatase RsbU (regulator of sigma subunit)/anti-sigma regulatory factor (Ser/Thr protein kinase)
MTLSSVLDVQGSPDLLACAIRTLTESRSAEELLSAAAELVVPAVGQWCLADLLHEPDLVTRVVARGVEGPLDLSPSMGGVDARRSSALALGALRALSDRPQRLLRLSSDDLTAAAESADPRVRAQGALAATLGSTDVLILGLTHRDRILGVLTIGRTSDVVSDELLQQLVDLALLLGALLEGLRLTSVQRSVSAALQTSLLPPLPLVPGLTLAARYVPADNALEVGGDWYDVFALAHGTTALVIGDVTGHDVTAAARMAEVRSLLRACAVNGGTGPATTLSALDQLTYHLALPASATCLYAQLSNELSNEWELAWSSAGHLPPVLLRDGSAEVLATEADLMLGVDVRVSRTEQRTTLRPGDVLLLMTDGLVEDRRVSLDDRLVVLTAWLSQQADSLPETLADGLLRELPRGDDDIALLVVKVDRSVEPQDVVAELSLPALPQAAGQARAFVTQYLRTWELEGLIDAAVLLTSELVSNAVLHTQTASMVALRRSADEVRVSVSDGSRVGPQRRRHSQEATTGRGLQLLEDLADEWGWEETPFGKTVWFVVSGGRDPWVTGTTDWLAELEG